MRLFQIDLRYSFLICMCKSTEICDETRNMDLNIFFFQHTYDRSNFFLKTHLPDVVFRLSYVTKYSRIYFIVY